MYVNICFTVCILVLNVKYYCAFIELFIFCICFHEKIKHFTLTNTLPPILVPWNDFPLYFVIYLMYNQVNVLYYVLILYSEKKRKFVKKKMRGKDHKQIILGNANWYQEALNRSG